MIDDPEGSLKALRADPALFENSAFAEEDGRNQPRATVPYRGVLGFLLFDEHARAVPLPRADWVPDFATFDALCAGADVRGPHGRLLSFPADGDRLLFGLWAPLDEAVRWNLPTEVRDAVERTRRGRIVLVAGGAVEPIRTAAAGFGLSPLQQRVIGAIFRTGNIRDAADELGLSYATAREAIASAAKRMSLPNTPAVIRTVIEAAFGILPGDMDRITSITDMLGVSERQAQIALLITFGASREAVARSIGASPAVVKKELEGLYFDLGIQSATELARLMAEIHALRLFARSVDAVPGYINPAIEPSRFAVRPGGIELIAWSDYGPASGKPVLIVHSNWSCRAVPRPLMEELQRRGWRPIAIDRPGFGATHLGGSSPANPFDQAVADTVHVLDICRVETIPVIARCGAQFVCALKAAAPDRLGPVVLVSPTPAACETGQRIGVVGAIKEAFLRRPMLIEFFFRIICSQLTLQRVEKLTRAIVKGAATDEALCDSPQFLRDRFRSLRPFSTGNFIGAVIEERFISLGLDLPAVKFDRSAILQGTEDNHNNLDEVAGYWTAKLPKTPIVSVPGGGRFMTSSHPALVVDWLERVSG